MDIGNGIEDIIMRGREIGWRRGHDGNENRRGKGGRDARMQTKILITKKSACDQSVTSSLYQGDCWPTFSSYEICLYHC